MAFTYNAILSSLLWTFICFIVALLILVVLYSIALIWIRSKYRHVPGPPIGNFFFGNGGGLNFNRVDNHKVFIEWAKEYGPVFKLFIFHKVIIFACSPELARELLTKSKYGKASELYNHFRNVLGVPFLGNGLVTNLDYDDWKIKRQAINPAFHRSFLENLTPVFNKTGDRMIKELEQYADTGKVIKLMNFLHEATLDVIGEVAFSYNIKTDYNPNRSITHDLYLCMRIMTETNLDITLKINPWKRAHINECREAIISVRETVMGILDKRLADLKNGNEVPRDILTIMLEKMPSNSTKNDIADEMMTLCVAGQETTANTLSFLIMELGRHPEYLDELRGEINRIVGNSEYIDNETLDKLDWIPAAIKETLRMYPPSGGTSREMPETGMLGDYKLCKGTNIIVSFFIIQYLHHANGFRFNPEWWLKENDPKTEFNFMPFSLGQRSCVGKLFAMTEAKILICKFLQKFDFKLDPTQRFGVEEASTQRPVDGVMATISKLNR